MIEQRAERLLMASIICGVALTGLAIWTFQIGLLPGLVVFIAAGAWMISFQSAVINLANVSSNQR